MRFGVAAIIENFDGTFLLHLRDEKAPSMKNEWYMVGGNPEEGETPISAIQREVLEETGLAITESSLITSFIKKDNQKEIFIFYGKVDTRNKNLTLGEGKEFRFFTKDTTLKLIESIEYPNQYLLVCKEFLVSRK